MKKYVILMLVLMNSMAGFSQYLDVKESKEVGLYPSTYSAGTIKRHKLTSDNIQIFSGIIGFGDIINYRYVGWAEFDIRQIPKGVKIDYANIYFNVIEASSSSNHLMYIVRYPYTITQNTTNNYLEDVYQYYKTFDYNPTKVWAGGSAICQTTGRKGIQLSTNGQNELESNLKYGTEKFKTAFIEYKLDNDVAIIDGGSSNSPPTLFVSYFLSNLKIIQGLPSESDFYGNSTIKVGARLLNNTRSTSEKAVIYYTLYQSQNSNSGIWSDYKDVDPIPTGSTAYTKEGEIKTPKVNHITEYYIKYEVKYLNNGKQADEQDNVYWKKIYLHPEEPSLYSITISGSTLVNENSSSSYTCTANYSDGSTQNVTSSASWSENSSYATINSSGILTTSSVSSDQSCTINASYGGKSDTHNVTIKNVAPILNSITISGANSVNENSSASYTCTANYSDGSTQNVTSSASWSENSSYATISSSGVLTTSSVNSDQSCTITASYEGKSDTHNVTIKNVTATLITISGSTSVNENSSASYTCTANYSDGSTQNVTSSAGWSENSSYATISSSGILTTSSVNSDQSCTITASYEGKSDTHNVTIKNVTATLNSITISGSTSVNENSSASYTCTANYSDGSTQNVTSSAGWSENSSYATISSSGILTTSSVNSDQSCTITASYGGKTNTHDITINNVASNLFNVALSSNGGHATASSSGSYMGYYATPEKAIDGNNSTSWHGTSIPDWIKVEFDKVYTIESIGLFVSYHTQSLYAELSIDGVNWTTVVQPFTSKNEFPSGQDDSEYKRFDITPKNAKFIRANFTYTDAPVSHIFQSGLKEIEAYGKDIPEGWDDGFETYAYGSFPSNWVADANAHSSSTNFVDNANSKEGNQSLKLYGLVGGCWGALAYRPLNVEPPFFIEVDIRNGNDNNRGCHPDRGCISLRKGTSWTNPSRSLIVFKKEGIIEASQSLYLGNYEINKWYKIMIHYEVWFLDEIKLTYWVDGVKKNSIIVSKIETENLLNNLELTVQEGSVWFDNVRVYEGIIPATKDDIKEDNKIKIYPNPTTNQVTIKFESNEKIGSQLKILNLNGQIMHEQKLVSKENYISTDNLVPGIYFIQINKDGAIYYKKLIVQK